MEQLVIIRDKKFRPLISRETIAARVKELAECISKDLDSANPLFVAVLNGSFMFASDLLKELKMPCEISFVKLSSYSGTSSSGQVRQLIGLNEDVRGRTVVLIEDIVDSGLTVQQISSMLMEKGAAQVRTATMLFKPGAFKGENEPAYVGFKIKNDFVLGYGMDYEGQGRNLNAIYVLA